MSKDNENFETTEGSRKPSANLLIIKGVYVPLIPYVMGLFSHCIGKVVQLYWEGSSVVLGK